jgi:hypothetical protein
MQPEQSSTNFEEVPLPLASQVKARCYAVIEIGTVLSTYPGKEPTKARQLMFFWELPTLTAVFNKEKGPEPFMVMKEVKYSTDDRSNLSKIISSWRGRPFNEQEKKTYDASECLNQIALLGFIVEPKSAYKGQTLEKVTNANSKLTLNTITQLPQEMREGMPAAINPQVLWDWSKMMTPADFNLELWKRIPKFVRDKMVTSDEFIQRGMASAIPAEAGPATQHQNTQAPIQQDAFAQPQQQPQQASAPEDSGFGSGF